MEPRAHLPRPLALAALLVLLVSPEVPALRAPQDSARVVRTSAPAATVRGYVRDSLLGWPLTGATVQLVSSDDPARFGRSVPSDSSGRFEFADVPVGRYMLGFFHPKLDSLGLHPVLRPLDVRGGGAIDADLAIPSTKRIREALCAGKGGGNSGMVTGIVRDAEAREARTGATVVAEWLEVSLGERGLRRETPSRTAVTQASGWFLICGVPRPGTLLLSASDGEIRTDRIEVEVSEDGYVRRDLYLGAGGVARTTRRLDSATATPNATRVGTGRLNGVVVALGGRPLEGAVITVLDGPSTRANARGEWSIANAPVGTRTIDVRALGYFPERRDIDVIDGAPPVRTVLNTLSSVLDTMRVTATRRRTLNYREFMERRQSGFGRYMTADEVKTKLVRHTSDLFRIMPGLQLLTNFDDAQIVMRDGSGGQCTPAFWLNNSMMRNLTASGIDTFVKPDEIMGIEVYFPPFVPGKFQDGANECGAVVIWTK